MEEEERDVENAVKSEERDDADSQPKKTGAGLEPHKNSETEAKEHLYVQNLPSAFPAPETAAANQKSSTVPVQTDNLVILDQDGEPIQYQRMISLIFKVIVTGKCGELFAVPSVPVPSVPHMLLPHCQLLDVAQSSGAFVEKTRHQSVITSIINNDGTNSLAAVAAQSVTAAKSQKKGFPDVFGTPVKPLPPGAPNWALRLCECEKIGESYRGYCNSEAELEAVLLLHKQQTYTVFGTRQSPSPAKPATRLMWKSLYVPYDGIPFVNAGSRAIVMECQFGPRRKGIQPKKGSEQETNQSFQYKATCPARIYIKKVRKFPEYKVPTDPKIDKKVVRQEQEKAFISLKKSSWDVGGVERYYIQLPTENAHLYHDLDTAKLPPLPEQICFTEDQRNEEEESEEVEDNQNEDGTSAPSRLHPLVADKIWELVAQGFNQVYTVRKQLSRRFVEHEIFKSDEVLERHNLCYFPTVNDIKNHIHEAQKALQLTGAPLATSDAEWKADADDLLSETVTYTLTPATKDVSFQKEGLLDGSDTLSPKAVQLFSSLTSLQPRIFAHFQGIQLHSVEGNPQQTTATSEPTDPSSLP
ncbi:calcium-responsive transcription factor-like isoform X3 [Myxocyprinus asiaticus]|uniref:calcium-responsive transcription factor-like isoform X3 n=1 Tax=Myxocyprinus asiaticus TaxID=70543 RepID=UPI0022229D81|nr:calcium-responsive transcription factor-like isoform X3 [Myxocyprinus asiaticus]